MLQQLLTAFILFCGTATNTLITPSTTADSEHLVVVMNNDLIFDITDASTTTNQPQILILEQPKFGMVTINPDRSFTFSPLENICEKTDHFSYLVNRPEGIDRVQVKIDILCEPLTILGGFSPDGDGINDHFTILGVQNFPNNSLAVFNSKGDEIYYMKGYNNDWNGELENGTIAPDDTYYYVFYDGTTYHSGYVKISHKVG